MLPEEDYCAPAFVFGLCLAFLPPPLPRGLGRDFSGLIQPRERKTFWPHSSFPPHCLQLRPPSRSHAISRSGYLQLWLLPNSFPGRSAGPQGPWLPCQKGGGFQSHRPSNLSVQGLQHTMKPRSKLGGTHGADQINGGSPPGGSTSLGLSPIYFSFC